MLNKDLLDILCCPACRGDLKYEPKKETLTCKKCGKVYPVKDDVPYLLPDHSPNA